MLEGIEAVAPALDSTPAIETTPVETTETTDAPAPEGTEAPAGGEGGDAPVEGAEETELPGEPEDEGIETDARTMDKATRDTIAALKKTNPAAAKLLAKQYYGRQAYEKEFPTVQDARRAKATIESLGGEDGITELQNKVQDYTTEMEQFANGDRSLVETLYKSNAESTVKMVEAALDIFAENKNMEALDSVLMRPMVQRLNDAGLSKSLVAMADFLKVGKGQEAYDLLQNIGEWLAKLTGDAEKMKATRTQVDPREKSFQEREQKLQQQEKENKERAIGDEVKRLNSEKLATTLAPFFKELKLSGEGQREFSQNLKQKVWAAMNADKVFRRQVQANIAKGDQAYVAKFINAKFNELLPGIFRNYKNTLYPNLSRSATPTPKPNGQTPVNGRTPAKPAAAVEGQAIQVKDAPAFEEVDWSKTNDTTWAKGFAHLKNGKYVYFH